VCDQITVKKVRNCVDCYRLRGGQYDGWRLRPRSQRTNHGNLCSL